MPNVIDLIEQDHRTVEKLFAEFEAAADADQRRQLGEQIVTELTVHAELEEKLLYPAAKQAGGELRGLVEHGEEEHQEVKQLISKVDGQNPDDSEVQATFQKIKSSVEEHVQEEENELLPKFRQSVDASQLEEMGQQLEQAKQEAEQSLRKQGFEPA
jgi:hemerythrin superfamily protein